MRKSTKCSPEVRVRSVRMVFEAEDQHKSQWVAIESIARKIGCTSETLRRRVRRAERGPRLPEGPTSSGQEHDKTLEREVRELRRTNEILKLASAHFAQAELDTAGSCLELATRGDSCTGKPDRCALEVVLLETPSNGSEVRPQFSSECLFVALQIVQCARIVAVEHALEVLHQQMGIRSRLRVQAQ